MTKAISCKDAAVQWGISQRRVVKLCGEGRIPGATQVGNMWIIPADAPKPSDSRYVGQADDTAPGTAKPFIKWAGGKGQLLDEIRAYYPFDGANITRYVEPFVGGGAVLFDVLNRYNLQEIIINDVNNALTNVYSAIQVDVDSLIAQLQVMHDKFIPLTQVERDKYYMDRRDEFNRGMEAGHEVSIRQAALMIFINKTCFNGLYRVNSKGEYNVPPGKYATPLICAQDNLRRVAEKLQNVKITCGDYKEMESLIDEHTFVYFDPPYRPLTTSSSFIAYAKSGFGDPEQKQLVDFFRKVTYKGAKALLSNSDPKNADVNDNFFDDLYADFIIRRVSASRMINSKAERRGKVNELLISNFAPCNSGELPFAETAE